MKQQGSISQAQLSPSGNMTSCIGGSTAIPGTPGTPSQMNNTVNQMHNMWSNNGSTINHSGGGNNSVVGAIMNPQIDAINVQQNALREQIIQSEQNLSAQHGVIINRAYL